MKPNLSIEISGVRLKNPVLLASGTAGFGYEIADLVNLSAIGGVVTKTITPLPREGNPPPRIWETPCGMLNSIGLQNPGLEAFLSDIAPELEKLDTEIIVSVGGSSIDDFIKIINSLNELAFIQIVELNLSCPNVAEGGIHFGREPKTVAELVEKVRGIARMAVWVKLSPQTSDIVEIARAAEGAGADVISVINTFPAMAIDIHSRRPRLGGITGGLSGAAVHPVAVATVYALAQKIGIPIIGIGGITRPEDAVEMLIAGASAVQIGSGYFSNTRLPEECVDFLTDYLVQHGFNSVEDIINSAEI
ncbi:dihydroorotate dehydrogenase [bacterium]|nr:dihydroorotate dehydrogenase [bacterium]